MDGARLRSNALASPGIEIHFLQRRQLQGSHTPAHTRRRFCTAREKGSNVELSGVELSGVELSGVPLITQYEDINDSVCLLQVFGSCDARKSSSNHNHLCSDVEGGKGVIQ